MSNTITPQVLPLDMPDALPVFEATTDTVDVIAPPTVDVEYTMRWTPVGHGYTDLSAMSESDKLAWYTDVMRDRMVRFDRDMADGLSAGTIRRDALAVASWALAIAARHTTYDVLSFEEDNEEAYRLHRMIGTASAVVTLCQDPHRDDAVTIHWGALNETSER